CKKDELGNNTEAVQKQAAKQTMDAPVTITSAGPAIVKTFTTLQINGTNFSPVNANNVVKFNGVTTSVLLATANTLIVNTPVGATTGKITVTTNGITATSPTNIKVVNPVKVASIPVGGAVQSITITSNGTIYGISGRSVFKYANGAMQILHTLPVNTNPGGDIWGPFNYYSLSRTVTDNSNNIYFIQTRIYLRSIGDNQEFTCNIMKINPAGQVSVFVNNFGGTSDFAISPNGDAFYAVSGNETYRIGKITSTGIHMDFGGEVLHPDFLAVDKTGNVFVSHTYGMYISKFSPQGNLLGKYNAKAGSMASDALGNIFYSGYKGIWLLNRAGNSFKYPINVGNESAIWLTIDSNDKLYLINSGYITVYAFK
ncbi:MAG: hypothetical protein EOO92_10065, partial [Pedobacter sp.]